MRILVDGMRGLGDNIYISGFIRTLSRQHEVHIATPWPELFSDIEGLHYRKPCTTLRTQLKNMARIPNDLWTHETSFQKTINVHYGAGTNIPDDLERIFGCKPDWKFPSFEVPKMNMPYIVVRPATLRKEWFAGSRNPKPEYIAQVIEWLKKKYHIVSIADFEDGQEWPVGDLPFADTVYHEGELTMAEMLGLCQNAAGIVGGVGWIVPFAIASGVPTFIIMGGNGEYNAPWKLTNGTMKLDNIWFASPENLCMCKDMKHNCNKEIPNLEKDCEEWKQIL